VASLSAQQEERIAQHSVASTWAQGLGKVFRRVALFRVDGTSAQAIAVHGMGQPPLSAGLSLLTPSPLRWAIDAASPIIGSGTAPGGTLVAKALGLSLPRAFAVIPLVVSGRLEALAYVDQGSEPLPITAASELFGFVSRILKGKTQARNTPPLRLICRSTRSRPGGRMARKPAFLASPAAATPAPPPSLVFNTPPPAAPANMTTDTTVPEICVADVVQAVQELRSKRRAWLRYALRTGAVAIFVAVIGAAASMVPLAPPKSSSPGEKTVQIPRNSAIAGIARHLENEGLISNAAAFV